MNIYNSVLSYFISFDHIESILRVAPFGPIRRYIIHKGSVPYLKLLLFRIEFRSVNTFFDIRSSKTLCRIVRFNIFRVRLSPLRWDIVLQNSFPWRSIEWTHSIKYSIKLSLVSWASIHCNSLNCRGLEFHPIP